MLPDAPTRRPRCPTRLGPQGRDAFTLIELLVVMAIMAVMAGITAASFVGVTRRASREGARENIMDVLRQARVSAVDTGRGAVVRVNPAVNSLYGIATSVIGAWHFEEIDAANHTPGARRYDGTINGAPTLAAGKLGLALHFDGAADYVDCLSAPIWNQTAGIRLEAWVRPEAVGVARPEHILSKTDGAGAGYFLGLDYDIATQTVQFEAAFAVPTATGPLMLRDAGTSRPVGQWYNVAAEFDGFEARLYVNGVMVDLDSYRDPETAAPANPNVDPNTATDEGWAPPAFMAATNMPMTIGCMHTSPNPGVGESNFFAGAIDEPRVLSLAGGSPVTLPQLVPMVSSTQTIYYDTQGFLNLAYHTVPVYIAVGDPYQAATLNANVALGDLALDLRPSNPFPPGGGLVMVGNPQAGYEVIYYTNAAGLTLNIAAVADRGQCGTAAVAHNAGDRVYFARAVEVDTTGLVIRP